MTGFHIDLARAICTELEILDKCQIQALALGTNSTTALADKQGEAIIAGISVTAETRARYGFSRSYLQFPARFAGADGVAHSGTLSTEQVGGPADRRDRRFGA